MHVFPLYSLGFELVLDSQQTYGILGIVGSESVGLPRSKRLDFYYDY